MDPVLAELYTNIDSAYLLIAAYALLWAVLLVLFIVTLNRTRKTQKDIDALEEALERRERKESE